MENSVVKLDQSIIDKLVLEGDLSKMSNVQKTQYYGMFCESLGLNPLTQPFQLIKFQGKEKLYATKDCTEQLRKIYGVSITEISTQELRGVYVVTAKAIDRQGKTDCSTGVVPIANLQGDNLANALMKAETKAKRRVTLSICGLGILDESELDTMKEARTEAIEVKESKPIETQYLGITEATKWEIIKLLEHPLLPKEYIDKTEVWLKDPKAGENSAQLLITKIKKQIELEEYKANASN